MTSNIVPFPEDGANLLESVEIFCLTYLSRAKDPVVSVDVLFEACQRELPEMSLSQGRFLEFLREHRQVTVVEGLDKDAPLQQETLTSAGIDLGPRAILKDRMPTPVDMVHMMAGQLTDMLKALEDVREHALEVGDAARVAQIDEAAARAKQLQETIKYLG